MIREFNLNGNIFVKLNEEGFKILVDDWNNFAQYHPSIKLRTVDDFKSQVDEDGYYQFQCWDFMEKFGKHLTIGSKPPFDLNVKIQTNEKD